MSKVKIEGNASGTGTLTISAPNTNTDRSLTLPDGAGEILTNASTLSSSNLSGALPAIDGSSLTGLANMTPAFHAYRSSNEGIAHQTGTTVKFDSERFDSDNKYDTSTYRFTPGVSGKYFLYANILFVNAAADKLYALQIQKNGTGIQFVANSTGSVVDDLSMNISAIVEANTTDYFNINVFHRAGSTQTYNNASYFGGFKIIE